MSDWLKPQDTDEKNFLILVVDESRLIKHVVSEALTSHYQVMTATTFNVGMQAIHSATPPDLILLDIVMPGAEGFETFRRFRIDAAATHIPIILLTAESDPEAGPKGLTIGAADFVAKPIVPDVLRARVAIHVQLRQQHIALKAAYDTIQRQKEHVEQALILGRDLQISLLPGMPDKDNRIAAAASMTRSLEVSGDFYDFFYLDPNRLCVCIADVSDKGVPAALFMGMCKALIRAKSEHLLSTADIVTAVNEQILKQNKSCMFVTLILAILDARTGQLTWTNAGHCPPLLVGSHETRTLKARHGLPVGTSDAPFSEGTVLLTEDETLFLYTDGATAINNGKGERFGETRLIEELSHREGSEPQSVLTAVTEAIAAFSKDSGPVDDMTMVALRFMGHGKRLEIALGESAMAAGILDERLKMFLVHSQLPDAYHASIKIVLDELLTNTHKFGKMDGVALKARISVEIEAQNLTIRFSDNGAPFNPLEASAADISSPLAARSIGGLGIHLCRNLMDQISYERRDGKNELTLTKQIFTLRQGAPIVAA